MDLDRRAVVAILKAVEQEGAYSNLAVLSYLKGHETENPAFIRELVYGVLRHKLLLDYNIHRYAQKVKASDLILLEIGFYQLCFMHVSDYAAVNETVALCKGNKGFINGVLRSFLRDGKHLEYDSLSVRYSCHESIVGLLKKAYGEEKTESILQHSLITPKLSERVNRNGLVSIQGKSSQKAVETLAPKRGERVLDICAAPGGKSLYAADLMENEGEIFAFDLHPHRVKLIEKEAERLGITILKTAVHDGTKLLDEFVGTADAVICDVPCSGFGTMAKKPEIKLRGISPELPQLYGIQACILETAAQYLKPGGRLLYSTCTLNPRENEKQVNAFIEKHPQEYKLLYSEQIFPEGDFDGFYISIVVRNIE